MGRCQTTGARYCGCAVAPGLSPFPVTALPSTGPSCRAVIYGGGASIYGDNTALCNAMHVGGMTIQHAMLPFPEEALPFMAALLTILSLAAAAGEGGGEREGACVTGTPSAPAPRLCP
eukprot:3744907-Rhodomonas_salina.1